MTEFCPKCGEFWDSKDFDADEGFCTRCSLGWPDVQVFRCESCDRWFRWTYAGKQVRCSTCRTRKRKKNDHTRMVRCARCGSPFRVLGKKRLRQLFCGGCKRWQYHYRKLRKQGVSPSHALKVTLAMSDTWKPKACLYCSAPIHEGKFCARCDSVKAMVNSRVRLDGETFELALAHVRVTYRGKRWRELQRQRPRVARTRFSARRYAP